MARVKVTINKKGRIPSLGMGPIRRPILITEELCNRLIKLGYPVKVIKSSVERKTVENAVQTKKEEFVEQNNVVIPKVVGENQQEEQVIVIKETTENNEVVEEIPVIDEDEVTEEVEILVNDPDFTPDAYYTEDFLTSKAICKKILDNRKVQYEDSSNFSVLKRLVKDSNPEVEIVEEESTETEE